jgi:UDP:flavonoid glycosyltransferase YjiC (YdhE family)
MQAFFISMGSWGDTLPFVQIAEAMVARGYRATVLANEAYQPAIEKRGLSFHNVYPRDRYQKFLDNRRDGDQVRSLIDVCELMIEQTLPVYEYLIERYEPNSTVVCGQAYGLGARVAQETHGIPYATAHLQPLWMRSVYDMPPMPRWMSRTLGSVLQDLFDRFIDHWLGRRVAALTKPLGVTPTRRLMRQWWHSPQCVLGLFPDWYSSPQPDWPSNCHLPGFPLPPAEGDEVLATDVRQFLRDGDRPIVFTQSSVASDARRFFEISLKTVTTLGRRGIFLAPVEETVPPDLPNYILARPYAPLDALLPHAAAHVHHGGVGTIAVSLRAGVPQLTVPGAFDQPDNSVRLALLGVGMNLPPKKYTLTSARRSIDRLLHDPVIADRCREFAGRMERMDSLRQCCDILDDLARHPFRS